MKLQVLLLSLVCSGFGVFAEDQLAPSASKSASTDAARPVFTPTSDVVKMSNAGVDERTILTFINSSPGFKVGAEDVIALHQSGVSLTLVNAMLQRPAKPGAVEKPVPPPSPKVATVTAASGPNSPIIYPTPAKEVVPLTDPVVVTYPASYYGGSSVLIVGSPYSYSVGQSYGGPCVGQSCSGSYYGSRNYGYGYYRGSRCRF